MLETPLLDALLFNCVSTSCRRLLSEIVIQTQHFRASGSAAKTAYRSSVYKTSPNTVRSMVLRISCIKTPPAA